MEDQLDMEMKKKVCRLIAVTTHTQKKKARCINFSCSVLNRTTKNCNSKNINKKNSNAECWSRCVISKVHDYYETGIVHLSLFIFSNDWDFEKEMQHVTTRAKWTFHFFILLFQISLFVWRGKALIFFFTLFKNCKGFSDVHEKENKKSSLAMNGRHRSLTGGASGEHMV